MNMTPEKETILENRIKAFSFPLLIAMLAFYIVGSLNQLSDINSTLNQIQLKLTTQEGKFTIIDNTTSSFDKRLEKLETKVDKLIDQQAEFHKKK